MIDWCINVHDDHTTHVILLVMCNIIITLSTCTGDKAKLMHLYFELRLSVKRLLVLSKKAGESPHN